MCSPAWRINMIALFYTFHGHCSHSIPDDSCGRYLNRMMTQCYAVLNDELAAIVICLWFLAEIAFQYELCNDEISHKSLCFLPCGDASSKFAPSDSS